MFVGQSWNKTGSTLVQACCSWSHCVRHGDRCGILAYTNWHPQTQRPRYCGPGKGGEGLQMVLSRGARSSSSNSTDRLKDHWMIRCLFSILIRLQKKVWLPKFELIQALDLLVLLRQECLEVGSRAAISSCASATFGTQSQWGFQEW